MESIWEKPLPKPYMMHCTKVEIIRADQSRSMSGWIYWLRNRAFPQMGKLGVTEEVDLNVRVTKLYTTGVPTPFHIIFARFVIDPYQKETLMHSLLSDKRVNPSREFFEETDERVKMLFSLCEGDWFSQLPEVETKVDAEREPETETPVRRTWSRPPLHQLLTDGEAVIHLGSCHNERVGYYSRANNAIMYGGSSHTLSQFVKQHYSEERPDRSSSGNPWAECKVHRDSSLVAMNTLIKPLSA